MQHLQTAINKLVSFENYEVELTVSVEFDLFHIRKPVHPSTALKQILTDDTIKGLLGANRGLCLLGQLAESSCCCTESKQYQAQDEIRQIPIFHHISWQQYTWLPTLTFNPQLTSCQNLLSFRRILIGALGSYCERKNIGDLGGFLLSSK